MYSKLLIWCQMMQETVAKFSGYRIRDICGPAFLQEAQGGRENVIHLILYSITAILWMWEIEDRHTVKEKALASSLFILLNGYFMPVARKGEAGQSNHYVDRRRMLANGCTFTVRGTSLPAFLPLGRKPSKFSVGWTSPRRVTINFHFTTLTRITGGQGAWTLQPGAHGR